jgi:hypothetical protein
MTNLQALGSEKMRAQNRKRGAGENQFGVRLGDIRKLAAGIKADHGLGLYRDYPVSRGCTSPFAPIWIREMVGRKG